MSQQQHYAQVQQWQELEAAGKEEAEWRRIEDANLALQEIAAARDEEFRKELEAKYPILRSW